jgi:rhodanese-related sulfurtransferase
MKKVLGFALIFTASFFAACGNSASEPTKIKQASIEQVKLAVDDNKMQFIDVRTVDEYISGHAPKAVNIPLDNFDKELAKLDKDKPVYLICESGRRSQKAAEMLEKANFKEIYNVTDGTAGWKDAGMPIEK